MEITTKTKIIVTEIKNGHHDACTCAQCMRYEITAGDFIRLVKNKDCDGNLNVGVEPIYDAEGEVEDFTRDKYYDLPVVEQLDMCCHDEGNRFSSTLTYEVAS